MTSGKLVEHEGQLGVVYDDQEELAALLRWQEANSTTLRGSTLGVGGTP